MAKVKGTSNIPKVLGIIGGILGVPCTLFGLVFANFAAIELGIDFYVYLFIGVSGSILGLVFGILAKKMPVVSGIMLFSAAILVGATFIGSCVLNLPVVILFLIGAIVAFVQKKEVTA